MKLEFEMHSWSQHENTICILCYELFGHLTFHQQIDKINNLLPHISRNSIGMKIANIRNLEDSNRGLSNGSRMLKSVWEKFKSG